MLSFSTVKHPNNPKNKKAVILDLQSVLTDFEGGFGIVLRIRSRDYIGFGAFGGAGFKLEFQDKDRKNRL